MQQRTQDQVARWPLLAEVVLARPSRLRHRSWLLPKDHHWRDVGRETLASTYVVAQSHLTDSGVELQRQRREEDHCDLPSATGQTRREGGEADGVHACLHAPTAGYLRLWRARSQIPRS